MGRTRSSEKNKLSSVIVTARNSYSIKHIDFQPIIFHRNKYNCHSCHHRNRKMERKAPFISSQKGKITYIRGRKNRKIEKKDMPEKTHFALFFEEKKAVSGRNFHQRERVPPRHRSARAISPNRHAGPVRRRYRDGKTPRRPSKNTAFHPEKQCISFINTLRCSVNTFSAAGGVLFLARPRKWSIFVVHGRGKSQTGRRKNV